MSDFSYNSYEKTIKSYFNNNYKIGGFKKLENNLDENFLILRHDIDFDISKAKEFAIFENEIGTDSTYFFRLNCKYYNLLSPNALNIIDEIYNLGHEIGIHLELNLFEKYNFEKIIYELIEILDKNLNINIHSYSLHEPERMGQKFSHKDICNMFGFTIGSYEDRFFRDIKYLSDSGGRWREGHFNEWINKEVKLQVLTHPIWWFKEFSQDSY